jgi:hypothetical protein
VNWASVFQSFARRKVESTIRAHLPGYATEVDLSLGRGLTAIGDAWTRERFGGPFFMSPSPDDGLPATGLDDAGVAFEHVLL